MKGTGLYKSMMKRHNRIMNEIVGKQDREDAVEEAAVDTLETQVQEEQAVEPVEQTADQVHEGQETGTEADSMIQPARYSVLRTVLDTHNRILQQIELEEQKLRKQAAKKKE